MKKTLTNAVKNLAVFAITLAAGFTLTMGSFNLFGELTRNQMRLLFAADILIILAVGATVHFFTESRRAKARRRLELQRRHEERVRVHNSEYGEIYKIIAFYDNVA